MFALVSSLVALATAVYARGFTYSKSDVLKPSVLRKFISLRTPGMYMY